MGRMISRGKGHDPFRFPYARCPQYAHMNGPPPFGGACVTVERLTELVTDLNTYQIYIDHTHSASVPAGWYYAGLTLYYKTIDGGVADYGDYRMRVLPPNVVVGPAEPRTVTDQGIAAEDPTCNLALFGLVQFASRQVPRLILEVRANPAASPVTITQGKMELWFVRSL